MGIDHCELGAWFAESGQLPNALVAVIRYHHTPDEAADHQDLVRLVCAADHMANHLMNSGSSAGYDPNTNPGLTGLLTGQSVNADQLSERMMRTAEEALQATSTG